MTYSPSYPVLGSLLAACVGVAGLAMAGCGSAADGSEPAGPPGPPGLAAPAPALHVDDTALSLPGTASAVPTASLDATHRFALSADQPRYLGFDLGAGGDVDVEVSTEDSDPLRFSVLREAMPGSFELLEPVIAPAGFQLTRIEPTARGRYVLSFPRGQAPLPRDVVVRVTCRAGAGRC